MHNPFKERGFFLLKFIRIILISGLLTVLLSAVQGISGYVIDKQNQPVDYATVRTAHSDKWIISDEAGYFMFPSGLNRGDSLIVSRIGFRKTSVDISDDVPVVIRLQREVIRLDAVNVKGNFSSKNTEWNSQTLSETDRIARTSAVQSLGGSFLKTYGGRTGILLLGIDGGKPEHTKIVLDGIDLTNPQNGQSDLSEIPGEYYEQMYFAKTPGISFGSGAMDGAIYLKPWHTRSKLSITSGSQGYRSESIRYNLLDRKNLGLSFIGGQLRESGNYSYSNGSETASRENNDFDRKFSGVNVRITHSDRAIITSSLHISETDRGSAGPVSHPSPSARRNNEFILANATMHQLFSSGHISFAVNHRSNDERYSNPGTDTSRHQVLSENAAIRWKQQISPTLHIHGSAEIKRESVESTSLGNRSRNNASGAVSISYVPWNSIKLQPSVRIDNADAVRHTYDVQLEATLPFSAAINAETGTGFRLPNFNDLYWPAGSYTEGNASLKPEESTFASAAIDIPLMKNGSLGIGFRSRKSKNLINWSQGSDWVWRPENINKSSRETASISFTVPKWINGLAISGNISFIKAKNESTGKRLEYVPDRIAVLKIGYTYKNLSFDVINHFTDTRTYTGYDENYNSVDKLIDPVSNITLGFHAAIPWIPSAQIHMVIENALDSDISFFPDYPEPGRSLTGGFTFKF